MFNFDPDVSFNIFQDLADQKELLSEAARALQTQVCHWWGELEKKVNCCGLGSGLSSVNKLQGFGIGKEAIRPSCWCKV